MRVLLTLIVLGLWAGVTVMIWSTARPEPRIIEHYSERVVPVPQIYLVPSRPVQKSRPRIGPPLKLHPGLN